ncbi:MAG TPA: hypothetical protein VFW96_08640 [Thermomicrobiales bacterium]|nr:hypothetical protein [Thermomicrobiales bacterium]
MRTRAAWLSLALLLALPVGVGGAPPVAAAGQCFAQTGYCVAGRFLDYWTAHGGLAINGYPLSDEFTETLEDGKPYTVQYFERVRMEYHPENADPQYQVLLGQFGRRILAGVSGAPTAAATPQAGSTFFPVTGHNVDARFMAYWNAHGGLAQFGYPLSEAFTQTLEDGKTYMVQYFERARFERHPANQPPYDVELGQFGRRILAARGAPAGCGPLPTGPAGDPLALYRDPQGRFTAQAPASWQARHEADGNVSLVAPNGAGVTLAITDASGRTLDEYTRQILQQIQQPAATNGRFELLCQDRVQLGAVPASRLRFIHNRVDTADGHPVPEEIDRIIALANGRALNAVGFMEPGDQADLTTIERIAASIVFGP